MNIKSLIISLLLTILFCVGCSQAGELKVGDWIITYDDQSNAVDIFKKDKLLFDNLYATYKLADTVVSSKMYTRAEISTKNISDQFGQGFLYQVTYTSKNVLPELIQSFYLYPDNDFILTDFSLNANQETETNYMSPVNVADTDGLFPENENNRALFIPFDNDKWIRYRSHPLNFPQLTSYEATAVFNNDSRNGLIVGSVEHDVWKTGIELASANNKLSSLICYGGIADETTRDVKPHGAISGTSVKSPKIFLGYFDDWREGLETYADANATIAPPKEWNKAVPFGWNSWGVLQFDLTFNKAIQVSDYFKNHLQPNNFENSDKLVYVGLDSGWNSFSEDELKSFVDRCAQNGQVAGIYWTPFTDWAKNPDRVFAADSQYTYKDVYLYANGQPQELDGAFALDPTHPAVEAAMKQISELFRRAGYTYVKMDFMTHGAMEADKWHDASIQTGIQGYNYGMKLLNKYFADMYINLSISPIFPAQYAQSRRIACDAWNKIKDTEYTMNALSYGWWQDRVYRFNDPDHIVLRDATDGENRARMTSAVITGMVILGDDYSESGDKEGKERTLKFATNPKVNELATGRAFKPVEGNGEKSENQFIRINEDGTADFAVFNYSEEDMKLNISAERLGLGANKKYEVKELWSNSETTVQNQTEIIVPFKDVMLFKINLLN